MTAKQILLLASILPSASYTASAQTVAVDFDARADFIHYETFSFGPIQATNPVVVSRVRDATVKDLRQRALMIMPTNGDLIATVIGDVSDNKEFDAFYRKLNSVGFGDSGWSSKLTWPGQENVIGTSLPETFLVIDMYDRASKQLVWRGTLSGMRFGEEAAAMKKLYIGIGEMLKDFPPPN